MSTPTAENLDALRFPVGRFQPRSELGPDDRRALIDEMAALPGALRAAVSGLGPEQLATPYRPGGWTVRQVVHHVADSHLNGYVRCKLAATEAGPAIKTYDQAAWAELADAAGEDVEVSLALLAALHRRWTTFLGSLAPEQWALTFQHPEWGAFPLERTLQLYAWHGRHHLAHVTSLQGRMGW